MGGCGNLGQHGAGPECSHSGHLGNCPGDMNISLERSVDSTGKRSIKGPVDREVCQGHGGSHSRRSSI